MKKLLYIIPFSIFVLAIAAFRVVEHPTSSPAYPQIEYPEGFRNWVHVKTAIIGPKNPAFNHLGGFHHIYANSKAVEGYTKGTFPDGAVIVFDVVEAVDSNSDIHEGKRTWINVMVKDSGKFPSTGGWGFEEFQGDSKSIRTLKDMATQCYNCHATKRDKDYVFSVMRN